MKWYADLPAARTRQLVQDAALLAWLVVWLWLADTVHDGVRRLAGPGRELESAGSGLGSGLTRAADRAGDLPVVGGGLRAPLDAAADAGGALERAGVAQQSAVDHLALLLAVVVAALPIVWALARWLPARLRWGREAAAAVRLRGDVELLALRAATLRPLSALATLGPEPVGRWRRGEPGAAQALATLELRELGLRAEPGPTGAGTGRAPEPRPGRLEGSWPD
jgi:hypothetical protein